MRAGTLRHLAVIEEETASSQDAFGEPQTAVQRKAKAWVSIEPLSGREIFEMRQIDFEVTHRVRMRREEFTVSPRQRFNVNGRVFEIAVVRELNERGREYEILCRERVT